jgi:hypothetical protein
MKINYVKGDATNPIVEKGKTAIIPHVCNVNGGWGAGFVLALSKKWKEPEKRYRKWFNGKLINEYDNSVVDFYLGAIDPIPVESNIIIINMLAQDGYKSKENTIPVRYWHLVHCMESVLDLLKRNKDIKNPIICAPKFACDLGGASWDVVEQLIEDIWIANGIPVTIYLWDEK